MMQLVLIGLSAGAASALLFASFASGSPFALLLSQAAPLPILIAALGWSHWAALIAALAAALGLATVFGGFFFIAFLLTIGLPPWWLGYLALLARPAERPTEDGLEWYPPGRLVVWAAILSALIVMAAILHVSTDADAFREALRRAVERSLRQLNRAPPTAADAARFVEILSVTLPGAAGVLNTVTLIVNLWLAAQIVKISGRLRRPIPDISAMEFPRYAPMLMAAALGASFLPGLIGIAGTVLAACMLVVYALLGFAILHRITRGTNSRPFILGSAYAALLLVWPVLMIALLGLADAAVDFRGRFARKPGPPDSGT
jgi:hypothetical protein